MPERRPSGPAAALNRGSTLVVETFRSIVLTKGMIIALIVLFIPSFIAIYTLLDPPTNSKDWPDLFALLGVLVFVQFYLLIFPLIYGTFALNEDMERRTMTYLVTRGSLRMEVFIHRYIGTLLALIPLFTLPIVTTYLLLSAHSGLDRMVENLDLLFDLLLAVYLGTIIYTALFCLFGIAFKKPLVVGLLFSFFWELVMAFIPLRIREFTIMYYVRSMLLSRDDIWSSMVALPKWATYGGSIFLLLFLTGIFLLVGSWVTYRKELT